MSVILDALRRARQGRPAAASPRPGGVPTALQGSKRPRGGKPPKQLRVGLLGGVLVIALTIWAGVQFGPTLMRRQLAGRTAATPAPSATPPTPSAAPSPAGPPSIGDMLNRMQQPPAIAPRAMGGPAAPAAPGATPPAAPAPPRYSPRARATVPPPPSRLPARPLPAQTLATPPSTAPPTPPVNHFDLAVRYQSLGNFEQALKHYLALLETDEFNVEARNNLGLLYADRGLVNEAVDQFRRAITIKPDYLRARSNLAVVLMNAGRLAEARAELRAAQAIDSRNPDLIVNMALVEKADHHPELAQELLLRAIGLEPTHAVAHYNLGLLYEESGSRERAVDQYEAFLKYAGPEHGALLSDVRQKIDVLMPRALPR